ncbi:ABC-three component system middle component 6 [Dankookia sp. GCM10030260]|uniref:ABC-three component system middle component 6 n=1 Tax=Dankookia sp. GCM10030260 TaxID=3273390 RepID=UPI003610EFE7
MSALPNKYVPIEYSLLGIAADLLTVMRANDTISALWDRVRDDSRIRTFDRFAAALTLLFAGGIVTLDNGLLRQQTHRLSPS